MTTPKLRKVWIVYGSGLYEPEEVLLVCRKERRALAFKQRCMAHEAKKPALVTKRADDPGFEEDYDEWDTAHRKWIKKHPARQMYEFYDVRAMAFDDAD